MRKLRMTIVTVGCRANQADSAWLARSLDPAAVDVVDGSSEVDVTVINSCAVTTSAERDVRRAINRARKTNGQNAMIVLTGCMVTACQDRLGDLGALWQVIPSTERYRIPSLIERLVLDRDTSGRHGEARRFSPGPHEVPGPLRRARPSLRIQDGCHHRCTYCVVPRGRGPQRSMDPSEVLERIGDLVAEGAREVVICGINLGEWGRDLTPRRSLADLLGILEERAPVERIRFSSIEPWAVNASLVERVSKSTLLAPHLHLPLQSGDDGVLKRMNRPYTNRRFRHIVETLVDARPGLAIGTDIIAGFPGESDAAFERTTALVNELPIAYLHAFGYSLRPGTPAASMGGVVPKAVIRERVARLRALGEAKRAAFGTALIGEVVHPLFERRDRADERLLKGVAGRYVTVRVEGDECLVNCIKPTVVQAVEPDGRLIGRLVDVD